MNEIEEEEPWRFQYPGYFSTEPPPTSTADPELLQRRSFVHDPELTTFTRISISGGEEGENARSAPPPRPPHPVAFCAFRKRKCWYIILLIIYIGVGVVTYVCMQAYSDDNFAGTAPGDSSLANASYFIITALSTVGYGDLHPQSVLAKGLLSAYVLVGLLLVAVVIVIIFRAFEDWEDHWIDTFVDKFLPGDSSSTVREKKGITVRRRITGLFRTTGGWIKKNAAKLAETFKDKTVRMLFVAALTWLASLGGGVLKWYKKYYEGLRKGYRNELPNPTLLPRGSCRPILHSLQLLLTTVADCFYAIIPTPNKWPHRWAEFIQESDRAEIKIIIALLFSFLLTVLGALVTNPYLAIMSVTTVGFGDDSFSTPATRIFAAVWLFPAFLVFGRVLSLVGDYLGSPDPCPSLQGQ